MKRFGIVLLAVVGLLQTPVPMQAQTTDESGCVYWNHEYGVHQDAYNYYMSRCYTDGVHYCDMADAELVAMGDAGNMLDHLGCYN